MASLNGKKQRGPGKRFEKGNPGGPGNPLSKQVNQLRAALLAAVTEKDIQQIAKMLLTEAKGGDIQAAKELLDRTLGKAAQALEISGADGAPLVPVINLTMAKPDACG